MRTFLRRHTRVWPTASGYAAMTSMANDAEARVAVERWSAHGWPLIVRRADAGEARDDDGIAVGLPLPPSLGKRRFKFVLLIDHIAAHAPPLALAEIVEHLPMTHRRAMATIARAAAASTLELRVFGSAAWQAQTGLHYLHENSDVDLLAAPATLEELRSIVALLENVQQRIDVRLDGEVVFPNGDAAAWREWAHSDATRVLVKSVARVALVSRSELLRTFDRRMAA
jgi:phosphoribosyl-dephospho-CoA transferase